MDSKYFVAASTMLPICGAILSNEANCRWNPKRQKKQRKLFMLRIPGLI